MNTIHTLVIACGNPLRGDDAVGPAAADIVTSWQTPGVKVLSVHQLVPELIEEMKQVQRVLFIDARVSAEDGAYEHRVLQPKASRRFFGHCETPANLLAILRELDGHAPKASLVTISAHSFDHGEGITARARTHLNAALDCIHAYLAEPSCTKSA